MVTYGHISSNVHVWLSDKG